MSSAPGESQDKTLPQSQAPHATQPINPADATTLTPPTGGTQATLITTPTPGSQTSSKHSITATDLSTDGLLNGAPRMIFEGRSVPSLGGIPLLTKLGQGGMGAVYFGFKPLLKQEVAVKVLPQQLAQRESGLVERFLREAQIAARVESPHLVRVTDVGEQAGLHYLVMEYVRGESGAGFIKRLLAAGQTGLDEATALDICIAATAGLAAAHQEGVIHRDVKPDNIMIPFRRGTQEADFKSAKLADLGLARGDDISQQSLTGANAAMGTPGYMSPEQALNARKAAKPADVFSMGATLYAFLTGRPPFRGETATETVVMTIQSPHTPLRELRAGVSNATADLVERCLSKDAAQRFADATAVGEALKLCRTSLGGSESAQADALKTMVLLQRAPEVGATAQLLSTPAPGPTAAFPPAGMGTSVPPTQTGAATASSGMWKPILAVATVVILIASFFAFDGRKDGSRLYANAILEGERALDDGRWDDAEKSFARALKHRPDDGVALKGTVDAQQGRVGKLNRYNPGGGEKTELIVVHSTEKESWLRWASTEFSKTEAGKRIQVQLVPRSSNDAMDEIMEGTRKPHVWTPASNLYRETFKHQWKQKFNGSPILSEASLAASPLVMVMFEDRHKVFLEKYKDFNSRTFTDAMVAGTWEKLGGPKAWGDVRFAVQHPLVHNSGMIWALLVTHRYYETEGRINAEKIRAPEIQPWYQVLVKASRLPGSSSNGVTDMFQKGPSTCDGIVAYESSVLEALSGNPSYSNVRIGYPKFNFWNDHPFFVLDVPWSNPAQRKAASEFQEFLLSDAAQKKVMEFGLRPASTRVSLRGNDTLWTRFQKLGISLDVRSAVADPNISIVRALTEIFKDSAPEK